MLPVGKILWAPTNAAHHNHLHVEGAHVSGRVPADCTSRWTPAIQEIVAALNARFGEGGHYQVWDDSFGWTHMGVYNCRNIQPRNVTPSQHAFSNAIDIGPYYGVAEQQKFYDFLTTEDDMPLSDQDVERIKAAVLTIDMPDQDDGEGRRGWTHALKQAWGHSIKAATDAAIARKVVEQIAAQPTGAITQAQIEAIAAEVTEDLQALRWRLDDE